MRRNMSEHGSGGRGATPDAQLGCISFRRANVVNLGKDDLLS